VEKNEERSEEKGYGEISQSRAAVFIAVGIIFTLDLLSIIFSVLPGEMPQAQGLVTGFPLIFSIIIDLFLGISLLRGKTWARTWMLLRFVGGIVIWGIVLVVQGDFGGLILNTGVLLALILLLTGVSTHVRLAGSVALAIVAALGGIILTFMVPLTNLPTTPETPIPDSFSTYTSEGFFSISYPPDWAPNLSIIEEVEEETKKYAKSLDLESQVSEMQVVFIGGKKTEDLYYPEVLVQVQPRGFWSLDTLVEAENQFAVENIDQYIEYSRIRTTIGGKQAIISTYQFDVNNELSKCIVSYVVGDEFIWSVLCGCSSQGFDAYHDTFNNIVRSLRVEY